MSVWTNISFGNIAISNGGAEILEGSKNIFFLPHHLLPRTGRKFESLMILTRKTFVVFCFKGTTNIGRKKSFINVFFRWRLFFHFRCNSQHDIFSYPEIIKEFHVLLGFGKIVWSVSKSHWKVTKEFFHWIL